MNICIFPLIILIVISSCNANRKNHQTLPSNSTSLPKKISNQEIQISGNNQDREVIVTFAETAVFGNFTIEDADDLIHNDIDLARTFFDLFEEEENEVSEDDEDKFAAHIGGRSLDGSKDGEIVLIGLATHTGSSPDVIHLNSYVDTIFHLMNSMIRNQQLDPMTICLGATKKIGGKRRRGEQKERGSSYSRNKEHTRRKQNRRKYETDEEDDDKLELENDELIIRSRRDITYSTPHDDQVVRPNPFVPLNPEDEDDDDEDEDEEEKKKLTNKKNVTAEINVEEVIPRQGRSKIRGNNRRKNKNRRKGCQNKRQGNKRKGHKWKKNGNNQGGAKGILTGLSTLHRKNSVVVHNLASGKKTVIARFILGPAQLKVIQKVKEGKRFVSSAATATANELSGRMDISVDSFGKSRVNLFRVLKPKNVRIAGKLGQRNKIKQALNRLVRSGYRRAAPFASKRLRQVAHAAVQQLLSTK